MAEDKLPNYLLSHRKKTGLSQDELAWLMGCETGAKIWRYEHCVFKPQLEAVLAYEILFRVPARELFGGIFEAVHEITLRRVQTLIKRLEAGPMNQATAAKLTALRAIAETKATKSRTKGHE